MSDQPQKRPSLLFVNAPGVNLDIYLAQESRLLSLYLGELEKDLAGRLGRKVKIAHKGKKGRIELEYYSEQDLETLLELLRRTDGEGVDTYGFF